MIIDNPFISGSLNVQNDVTASNIQILGSASAAYFTGSFVGDGSQLDGVTSYTDQDTLDYINTLGVLSGSAQIASDISGSFTSLSSSLEQRISSQESFSSSLDATFATDAQVATAVSALNAATSSYALQADISGAFALTSSSLAQRVSAQEEFSSSLNATFATDQELSEVSGALAASIAGISTDFDDITNKPTLISSSLQFNTLDTPFTGSFTGSFYGDGSNLSGVTSYTDSDTLAFINSRAVLSGSIAELTAVTASFLNTGSVTITHSFNSKNVSVQVYDSNDIYIIPQEIALVSNNAVKITFAGNSSGFAVVAKGGHIVSGSVPVPQLSTVASSFTSATTHTVTHNFNTKEVIVSVYENDSLIIPDTVTTDDLDNVTVTFPEAISGRVVVVKAGHIVSGSIPFDNLLDSPFDQSVSAITASKHIVPSQDSVYDLGSSDLRFRDLYLSSASIYLGNTVISEDNVVTTASLASVLPDNVLSSSFQIHSEISGAFDSVSASMASERLKNTTDTLDGDLTVTGKITAQEFHTEFVSASIIYQSGSTQFGNSSDDTHIFIGNMGVGTDDPYSDPGYQSVNVAGTDGGQFIISSGSGGSTNRLLQIASSNVGADIQTIPGIPLRFLTSTTEKMRIQANGNVGIGTDGPNHLLHVNGTSAALGSDSMRMYINRTGTNVASLIFTTGGGSVANGWAEIGQTDADGDLYFKANASAAGYNTRMVIKGSSGNIGIGTTAPTAPLELYRLNTDSDATGGGVIFSRYQIGGSYRASSIFHRFITNSGDSMVFTVSDSSNPYISDTTALDGRVKMVINTLGNVGIGTSVPTKKLVVRHDENGDPAILKVENRDGNSNAGAFIGFSTGYEGYATIGAKREGAENDSSLIFSPMLNESAIERMRITSTGAVGIGTTSLIGKLTVSNGAAGVSTAGAASFVNNAGSGVNILPKLDTGNYNSLIASGDSFIAGNGQYTPIAIGVHDGSSIRISRYNIEFGANNGFKAIINSEGNLGVGTTAPGTKLHVNGAIRAGIPTAQYGAITSTSTEQYGAGIEHNRLNSGNNYDDTLFLTNTNLNDGNYAAIGLSTNGGDGQHHRAQIRAYRASGYTYAGDLAFNIRQNGGDWNERVRLTADGQFRHNKVDTMTWTGIVQGLTDFSVYIFTGDEGGGGNIFKVEAGFAHYFGMSYNCVAEFWVASRGTTVSINDVYRYDTAFGGTWTASKSSADTLRIQKTAGTYSGSGRYWIKLTKVNYSA